VEMAQNGNSTEVLYDFTPSYFDEIDLYKGEIVEIIDQSDDPWWKAKNVRGSIGMIPSNYVVHITISRPETPIDNRQLPIGWKKYYDVSSNDEYYHNIYSGNYILHSIFHIIITLTIKKVILSGSFLLDGKNIKIKNLEMSIIIMRLQVKN
jgi:hypothetical protein